MIPTFIEICYRSNKYYNCNEREESEGRRRGCQITKDIHLRRPHQVLGNRDLLRFRRNEVIQEAIGSSVLFRNVCQGSRAQKVHHEGDGRHRLLRQFDATRPEIQCDRQV